MSMHFSKKIIGGSNSIPLLQAFCIAFLIFPIYMAVVIMLQSFLLGYCLYNRSYHPRCQISSLYSAIVRSEEKYPASLILISAILAHFSGFTA